MMKGAPFKRADNGRRASATRIDQQYGTPPRPIGSHFHDIGTKAVAKLNGVERRAISGHAQPAGRALREKSRIKRGATDPVIVSFKHKFIFVKGVKVAGTSIEIALAPSCGPSDIVTPIAPADEFNRLAIGGKCQNYDNDAQLEARYLQLVRNRKFKEALDTRVHSPHPSRFYNHMPLSDIEARLTLPFNEYSVVISERNPYAKIISFANWELAFSDNCGEAMEHSVDDIRRSIGHLFRTGQFRRVRNIRLYRSGKSYKELIVLRQESLESGLAQLFGRLGLGERLERWPHAKKGTANHLLDPAVMFTREQLDLVNQEFSVEFEKFGYEQI